MLYSYKCIDCENIEYFKHPMNEKPEFKCKCGSKMVKELCSNFILRGWGWASRDIKEKNQREKKSESLKKSQRDTGLSIYDRISDGRKLEKEKQREKDLSSGKADKKIII